MTNDEILEKLGKFGTQFQNGLRAPNKALLLLLALGKICRHQSEGVSEGSDGDTQRLLPYDDWATELAELLNKYGRPGQKNPPDTSDPFCLLHDTDKLWEVPNYDSIRGNARRASHQKLLDAKAVGGFPAEIHAALTHNPRLISEVATRLLQERTDICEALHGKVLKDAGLAGVMLTPFNPTVLHAYDYRCAICNYDARIQDGDLLGLEAVHIRSDEGGPDEVSNGLALCPVHQAALKQGGISLREDYSLLVSPHLQSTAPDFWFKPYADEPIRLPNEAVHHPAPEYIAWHREQIWRG